MAGRQTLRRPVSVRGRGLHTGCEATVTLRPAPARHGVVFRRIDLPGTPTIPAHATQVQSTERRTSLGRDGVTVDTVEHLLAAVAGHRIDDLTIELDGPELPACDGSARFYADAIRESGIQELPGEPARCRPAEPFTIEAGGASYRVAPASGLKLTVSIDWNHPLIGRQSGSYDLSPEIFDRELAGARTFGFEHEVAELRQRGLIQGATLSSAVVLSGENIVAGELRWPDEFVRHKSLDLLGDLALAGGRIEADIEAHRPSHTGNVALARALGRHSSTGTSMAMGIEEILKVLPHRYPMLLVDRILEVHGTERIVGIKNVTINEPFFQGHFPGHPVMPGVLIVEAMAQVGGMLVMSSMKLPQNAVVYFLSIDGVKFRKPVVPGDQLRFEVETVQVRGKTVKMKGVGLVDGKVAAEAEFMAQIVEQ